MSSFIQGLFSPGNTVDPLVTRMAGTKYGRPDGLIIPKKILLSSECYITFLSTVPKNEAFDLVQIDNITKTKRFIEKKNFKPFGHEDNVVLIDDAGWDIRISARKTDANLSKFIYLQEQYLRKNEGISKMKPMFEVREVFLYGISTEGRQIKEQLYEEYIYKNVSIIGFDEDIAGNAGEIRYNIQMFSTNRTRTTGPVGVGTQGSVTTDATKDRVSNIIDDLLAKNLQ